MSVIRVGSSGTYAEGWDSIFGGRNPAAKKSGKAKGSKAKAAPATKAGKKKASRVVKKKVVTKASKPGKSRRG
ncbi:MAG: hypothetical protein DWI04_07095 [Planctomycetota bacterium]|nr:MAG: hypothetical protein DWI04_07095 [Planctomycetota bacterium]